MTCQKNWNLGRISSQLHTVPYLVWGLSPQEQFHQSPDLQTEIHVVAKQQLTDCQYLLRLFHQQKKVWNKLKQTGPLRKDQRTDTVFVKKTNTDAEPFQSIPPHDHPPGPKIHSLSHTVESYSRKVHKKVAIPIDPTIIVSTANEPQGESELEEDQPSSYVTIWRYSWIDF